MNFAGVIAEYDPFHNGHRAQLALLRRQGAQTIAVCMSAGAVQRGGLPLYPEPVRVRAALEDPCCKKNPLQVEDFMVRRILEEVTGRV